jgi:hypothetical protein
VEIWLTNRWYYLSIDGSNNTFYDLLLGTVQGLILGQILYTILVSPMFGMEKLFAFLDDTFVPRINKSLLVLVEDMKKSLKALTKWLKDSGQIVNKSKTELFIFYKREF